MNLKKMTVLFGSPRKNGNTASLLAPFLETWREQGNEADVFDLYRLHIEDCRACRSCQNDLTGFGCIIDDDMRIIAESAFDAGIILLATPIYAWYCTAPVKAAIDRLLYGFTKYYGETRGPSLWKGKGVAILTTCGYPPEKGADLFEEGVLRLCRHCGLNYLGMLAEHHLGYDTVFMDEEKAGRARTFALKLSGADAHAQ